MSLHYSPSTASHRTHHSSHSQSSGYNQQQYGNQRPASSYGNQAPPYQSQRPQSVAPPPPAQGDPQLWSYFTAVDTDRSGQLSAQELQTALVNGNWTKFDLDTVKMLMSIFDQDRDGGIGFHEFSGLWKYISDWQNVFRHFDRDRSGSIEGDELAEALRSFGYTLSPTLLQLVELKYATASAPASTYGPPPGITFDRFVRACVVVKTLTETFQRADTDRDGWIQVNYEQFMKMVLAAP